MRAAVGECWHETNTFSPIETNRDRFEVTMGDAVVSSPPSAELSGICSTLRGAGVETVGTLAARAVPGGRVTDAAYEFFANTIVSGVAEATPDVVVLSLHGSMVTETRDDPEGDLLMRLAETVAVPIVVSLDHHANVTPTMVEAADALVAYREHPHTDRDMRATGQRAAQLVLGIVRGALDPRTALITAPMVTTTRLETATGPMGELFNLRAELESRTSVRAVSLCPVQAWLDVPDIGFTAVVVTDGDQSRADACARELATAAWTRRDRFAEKIPTLPEVIGQVLDIADRPVILSDRGDVTLGGAPGDSPVILAELLNRPDTIDLRAAIPVVDPASVDVLWKQSGPHTLGIGGRLTPGFEPVKVAVRERQRTHEPLSLEGDYAAGSEVDMGRRVTVEVLDRPITLILSDRPGVTTHHSFFSAHGVDPAAMDLLVVKSIGTFKPGFADIAGTVLAADTPGACSVDLSRLPFERARPFYPLDDPDPTFSVRRGSSVE